MKKNYTKNYILLSLLLSFFSVIIISAQQFKRIESLANLGAIANNNGVAIADFDLDNDLDIFIVGTLTFDENDPNTWSRLLQNNNDGSFTDITIEAGFAQEFDHKMTMVTRNSLGELFSSEPRFGEKMAASWGDYNNDGYPDIFLSNALQSQLYKNNGNGTFTNVTVAAGFEETCEKCYIAGALWWDYNGDGNLDIYLSDYNYDSDNKLYKNNGDGSFTLISDTNLTGKANSFSAISIDVNNDGLLDLYVANDFDLNNFLYINQGGNDFTEAAVQYGLADPYDGMGLAISDFDNNGVFEILVSNIKENGFYVKNNNNTYDNKASEVGISNTDWSWGAVFSDFDLDGYEDFFITTGISGNQFNHYFKNVSGNNGRIFNELPITQQSEIESSVSRSTVSFDYDNDGDLDLIVTNYIGNLFFYENAQIDKSNEDNNSWAKFKLVGTTSNRDALGSKIEVSTENNLKLNRFYQGSLYQSQSLLPVHFGLNNANLITSVTVIWPSGSKETYTNLPVNKTIEITENNGYQIIDENASDKIYGCTNVDSCNYNPNATEDDGSCVFLESGEIAGNSVSSPLFTENYMYNNALGDFFLWNVENGEIIDGQGTDQVTVKWDIANQGTLFCINGNDDCKTEEISFQVILETQEEDDNNNSNNESFSTARLWNEALLNAIRKDFARPTVHARNLFHSSIAMYDSWAIYNDKASTYLIGKDIDGFSSEFNEFISTTEDKTSSIDKTISYAVYRLLMHRFKKSPNASESLEQFNDLMSLLNYDPSFTSVDYSDGDPAALGNYIAKTIIEFGLQDGSNELNEYENLYYQPVNEPLNLSSGGSNNMNDPNRWQPLTLDIFIDQSGNRIDDNTPDFLGPEWGNVTPFAMEENDITNHKRSSTDYKVYLDPGKPPFLDINDQVSSDLYKWGFTLVSVWGSHLSPYDGITWDISPGSIGNIALSSFPENFNNYSDFYNLLDGGDGSSGRSKNPITGLPYESQIVPRGDYARVLAEFWADGPDSETPPGHWFVLLNYVNDHPDLVKKMNGVGETLSNLEWDIKAYFMLAGAMHDSAISAWSIKGWYDYVRPISSIRYMANKGQSSDNSLSNYNEEGITLIDNYIEVINENDNLAGTNGENIGKIKVYSWKGHDFVNDTEVDEAGVGWILAENWWPYQRPSFVTPPFAGYVSGHSTFSRAAAEVLTLLTGSEYFPGGIGEFVAKKNEFLVFEEGPSQDIILQWATYRDASDQCSLSRIWGGIHPPMDDIPGRVIGEKIGKDAYNFAMSYFHDEVDILPEGDMIVYPNPINSLNEITITNTTESSEFFVLDLLGRLIPIEQHFLSNSNSTKVKLSNLSAGIYILKADNQTWKIIVN